MLVHLIGCWSKPENTKGTTGVITVSGARWLGGALGQRACGEQRSLAALIRMNLQRLHADRKGKKKKKKSTDGVFFFEYLEGMWLFGFLFK